MVRADTKVREFSDFAQSLTLRVPKSKVLNAMYDWILNLCERSNEEETRVH